MTNNKKKKNQIIDENDIIENLRKSINNDLINK